ncbi:unnamed protein product [Phytophthora lilii]|uniref:RxLR effector protein n=1 Tax=Phytophthora lilii TaxID=2077276 RepID=A0A9W6TED6_9STRA|nr:unnamed protein product [Phytophthora lilii]
MAKTVCRPCVSVTPLTNRDGVSATTDVGEAKQSSVTASNSALSIETSSKRLLRSYETTDEEAADEDDEERAFSATPAWIAKWTARAERWVEKGKTPGQIKEKYDITRFTDPRSKAKQKYNLFLAAWLKEHPGGI